MRYQKTLNKKIKLEGIGLHSGDQVHLCICPAPAGSGISFRRVDLEGKPTIRARVDKVSETTLATTLSEGSASVSTVEHCMAALCAMGVDNAVVEVDGPEIPILDGSAEAYVKAIKRTGLATQRMARRVMKVQKPIRVEDGDKFSILLPYDGFRITYSIEFNQGFPGEQHFVMDVNAENFAAQLSRARTFGFLKEVEMLRSIGKARGASMDNAVALHEGRVLNPEGLRMPDEMVRHKMLDAVGDLALCGGAIEGHLIVHKGGHELHRRLVESLLERDDAWSLVNTQRPRAGGALRTLAAAAAAHA